MLTLSSKSELYEALKGKKINSMQLLMNYQNNLVCYPSSRPGGFSLVDGILMGGFPLKTQCVQFAKLGVFQKIRPKKHPIWNVFAAIWYSDGSQNHAF